MKQKIFLTSVIAMGFVLPAMAEPSNTDTFPQSGLMQEDYTYTNSATSTNMAGVYEGEVNAVAQYEDVLYQIARGKYLPANSETTIDCDQNGYFCAGDNNGVYYSSSAQGLTQCPSGYGNSGTGASANTDCYRICTNADVEHSTGTMNGGYYYGDNNQCEPTACVHGWHLKDGTPDLNNIIGQTRGDHAFRNNNGTYNEDSSSHGAVAMGIESGSNKWAAYYDLNKGVVFGESLCSTRNVTTSWYNNNNEFSSDHFVSELIDETGEEGALYCYCKLKGFIQAGGNTKTLSTPWVYRYFAPGGKDHCASVCPDFCGDSMSRTSADDLAFRAAMFGAITPSLASCEANTITINWDGASATEINANNAGTATYGSDIRTPRSATPVPGKTFTGWRFSAPQQASVQEP